MDSLLVLILVLSCLYAATVGYAFWLCIRFERFLVDAFLILATLRAKAAKLGCLYDPFYLLAYEQIFMSALGAKNASVAGMRHVGWSPKCINFGPPVGLQPANPQLQEAIESAFRQFTARVFSYLTRETLSDRWHWRRWQAEPAHQSVESTLLEAIGALGRLRQVAPEP